MPHNEKTRTYALGDKKMWQLFKKDYLVEKPSETSFFNDLQLEDTTFVHDPNNSQGNKHNVDIGTPTQLQKDEFLKWYDSQNCKDIFKNRAEKRRQNALTETQVNEIYSILQSKLMNSEQLQKCATSSQSETKKITSWNTSRTQEEEQEKIAKEFIKSNLEIFHKDNWHTELSSHNTKLLIAEQKIRNEQSMMEYNIRISQEDISSIEDEIYGIQVMNTWGDTIKLAKLEQELSDWQENLDKAKKDLDFIHTRLKTNEYNQDLVNTFINAYDKQQIDEIRLLFKEEQQEQQQKLEKAESNEQKKHKTTIDLGPEHYRQGVFKERNYEGNLFTSSRLDKGKRLHGHEQIISSTDYESKYTSIPTDKTYIYGDLLGELNSFLYNGQSLSSADQPLLDQYEELKQNIESLPQVEVYKSMQTNSLPEQLVLMEARYIIQQVAYFNQLSNDPEKLRSILERNKTVHEQELNKKFPHDLSPKQTIELYQAKDDLPEVIQTLLKNNIEPGLPNKDIGPTFNELPPEQIIELYQKKDGSPEIIQTLLDENIEQAFDKLSPKQIIQLCEDKDLSDDAHEILKEKIKTVFDNLPPEQIIQLCKDKGLSDDVQKILKEKIMDDMHNKESDLYKLVTKKGWIYSSKENIEARDAIGVFLGADIITGVTGDFAKTKIDKINLKIATMHLKTLCSNLTFISKEKDIDEQKAKITNFKLNFIITGNTIQIGKHAPLKLSSSRMEKLVEDLTELKNIINSKDDYATLKEKFNDTIVGEGMKHEIGFDTKRTQKPNNP